MLRLNNLSIAINGHSILHNIHAHAQPGDIILVVGQNGSGKSTLLNVIAGTITPKMGSIVFNKRDITALNEQQRATIVSRLHQNPSMNTATTLTVAQNIALARLKNRRATLHGGLSAMGATAHDIQTLLHKRMSDLSGGQRQLIAFEMATMTEPAILLLDEPTAALDQQATTRLLKQITQQAALNKTITIMVTHDLEHIEQLSSQVWILNHGTLRVLDNRQKTITAQILKEAIHA